MAVSDFNIIKDGKKNSIPIMRLDLNGAFEKYDNEISEIKEELDNIQAIETTGY